MPRCFFAWGYNNNMPVVSRKPSSRPPRHWFLDGLSAFAFIALALIGGKGIARALGPIPALFFLVMMAGAGYYFGCAAWRGLMGDRLQK